MTDAVYPMPQQRPLVTFAVFAYNQEEYIREAVKGAFAQTYMPLEIILSDDCSNDKTFEIMREMARAYRGPHRVRVRQSDANGGLAAHMNGVAKEIVSDIVVVSAGDDVSFPERTEIIADLFRRWPDTFAGFSNYRAMQTGDDDAASGIRNQTISVAEVIIGGGGVQIGATYGYRRECFLWPEPLPSWIEFEDRILPFRAALLGTIRYSPAPLVYYRLSTTIAKKQEKTNRILGYDHNSHLEYLIKTTRSAAGQGKCTWGRAFFVIVLIRYLRWTLRNDTRWSPRWLTLIPLRFIRKVSVLIATGADRLHKDKQP